MVASQGIAATRRRLVQGTYYTLVAIKKQVFMSSDIEHIFPGKVYTERSRVLRRLKNKKMIFPEKNSPRKYIIRFENNYLLRSIIENLGKNNFLPILN